MGKDLNGRELGRGLVQRKDGRYVARRIAKNGKQIILYGSNYQKLKKDLDNAIEAENNGINSKTNYTVEGWFYIWFATCKEPTVKPSSASSMKRQVKNIILKNIGDIEIKNLIPMDIQTVINTAAKKYARRSITEALSRLSESLAFAVSNKIILTNPAYSVYVPKCKNEKEKNHRWLDSKEIAIFLNFTKNDWFYEMYYVMIYTGMRIGEIGGLKWEDIDFENRCIVLNQALICYYSDGIKIIELGGLKTTNSYRTIPMVGKIYDILKKQQLKVKQLKERLDWRYRAKDDFEDLVFVSTMGSPVTRYVAEKAINSSVKQINLDGIEFEHLYPHALRHTFASLCYFAGMDVKTTQNLMGHAHISTTLDIYSHLSNEYVKADVSKLNNLIFDTNKMYTDMKDNT